MSTIVTSQPHTASEVSTSLSEARRACGRIPPLWPLQNFIAVNPFLGFADRHFLDTCSLLDRVAHQPALMSRRFFQSKFHSSGIRETDLEAALDLATSQLPEPWSSQVSSLTVTHLKLWLHSPPTDLPGPDAPHPAPSARLLTFTEHADLQGGRTHPWNTVIINEISKHCAAYYDDGQAGWRLPWSSQSLYASWKEAASIDATLPLLGLKELRALIKDLPASPAAALQQLLDRLRVPSPVIEDYLHRLLLSVFGWSSHVQFRVRQNGLNGIDDDSLLQLLVIRLAHDAALAAHQEQKAPGTLQTWADSLAPAAQASDAFPLLPHYLWQLASELSYQRRLLRGLKRAPTLDEDAPTARPPVQAVFCIDVRSEVFRRCLEQALPGAETLGFAGFFGMPIEFIPLGHQHGGSQCPVLITPKFRVREHVVGATADQERQAIGKSISLRRLRHAWNAFKSSAVSCFSFVETAGLGFLVKLAREAFLTVSPAPSAIARTAPQVQSTESHSHRHGHDHPLPDETGIPPADQVALAQGALRHMGLTSQFSRLVLLCGHGAQSANNPYAAGLHCGACGGHTGEANARVAATLLNTPRVRAALKPLGIVIPDDTVFVAGLHNTTTDEVQLFELDALPATHQNDVLELQTALAAAGAAARRQRGPLLGIIDRGTAEFDLLIHQRASDWSQVRPEWGLAGNAALIAAPRDRTRHLDLGGRVFLHHYQHEQDAEGATLELILTAPMIVASWINLQYYGSTVNNALLGSGNKVLHNVVGTVGVCLGNGGDLRSGLPLQSLHDGSQWLHEPLRLSVFIEAPREAIERALSRHPDVTRLIDHAWLHLFAIETDDGSIHRRLPGARWTRAA